MAAKFGLTIFVVLVATQVFPSSGSCVYPSPPCSLPAPCGPGGAYVSGPAHGPVYVPGPSPVYVGSGGASAYYPSADCSVPPVYLPPPKFPVLPTIHAPNPLTIPLQVPSVIPVGKVCVCKAIQIQPSVIPVQKPCVCKPSCLPVC